MPLRHCYTLIRRLNPGVTSLLRYNNLVFLRSVRSCSTFNVKKKNGTLSVKNDQSVSPKQLKELHERYLFVRTCVDYWEDLPPGVAFDTAYIDTHPGAATLPEVPVIVALHDSPGSTNDLIPILQPFCNLGYRVIAVNFPGFGKTKGINSIDESIFTGTTEERSVFFNSFLETVGVESIDLLIGHGTGCNTALHYATNIRSVDPTLVKSIALLSPIGHRFSSYLNMYPAIREFEQYWNQYPLLRALLRLVLHVSTIWKFRFLWKYPLKYHVKIMLHYAGFQYPLVQSDSSMLSFQSIPFLVTHNNNSNIVDTEVMEEYRNLIGITDTCVVGKDKSQPDTYTSQRYVVFDDEDYSLEKYSGQITLLLLDLLKNVLKKR